MLFFQPAPHHKDLSNSWKKCYPRSPCRPGLGAGRLERVGKNLACSHPTNFILLEATPRAGLWGSLCPCSNNPPDSSHRETILCSQENTTGQALASHCPEIWKEPGFYSLWAPCYQKVLSRAQRGRGGQHRQDPPPWSSLSAPSHLLALVNSGIWSSGLSSQ